MATPVNEEPAANAQDVFVEEWQTKLLPVVVVALFLLAAAFFALTYMQARQLSNEITYHEDGRLDAALKSVDERSRQLSADDAIKSLQWKTGVVLEAEVIRHRYSQVNAVLEMRAWTRYVGFLTGMILSFIGAFFILAKLTEAATQVSGEATSYKLNLATTSPGIILAFLGTLLMVITLTVDFKYGTADAPVYFNPLNINDTEPAQPAPELLPPPSTPPSKNAK